MRRRSGLVFLQSEDAGVPARARWRPSSSTPISPRARRITGSGRTIRATSRFPPCPSAAEGNRLLRRMFDPDVADEPNATVDARARTRERSPRVSTRTNVARARVARGARRDSQTRRTSARARGVPGWTTRERATAPGRGVGPGGGCRLVRSAEGADPSAIEPAFACACAEGYEGVACERRREDRPVAAKSAGFRPRRDGAKIRRRRRSRPGDGADARGNFSRGDVRGRRGGAADWARGVRHLARTPEETTRGDAPNQSRRALVCAHRTAPRGRKGGTGERRTRDPRAARGRDERRRDERDRLNPFRRALKPNAYECASGFPPSVAHQRAPPLSRGAHMKSAELRPLLSLASSL